MEKNRTKNLVTIFICVIAIVITLVLKISWKIEPKGNEEPASSSIYLEDNQLREIDDSLYDENASDY